MDPPYFGNVQYAELIDFCYVWLRKLVDLGGPQFSQRTTRNEDELTGNVTLKRGFEHLVEGLSSVFAHSVRALREGAPLAFTYHHNDLKAYYPVAVAIAGHGFKVRRENMKILMEATRGKVFTMKNLSSLVEHTRLREYRTSR